MLRNIIRKVTRPLTLTWFWAQNLYFRLAFKVMRDPIEGWSRPVMLKRYQGDPLGENCGRYFFWNENYTRLYGPFRSMSMADLACGHYAVINKRMKCWV